MIIAQSTYNNLYRTIYDVSIKNYEHVSRALRFCLEQNLNGTDIWRALNIALREYPELLNTIIHVVQNSPEQKINSETMLLFFRILESKARMEYREYTLKLNSIISIFFFYVFLVPTPITILASGLSPEASSILLPIFFIVNMIVFKIFFNRIVKIKGVLLG